jgi:hypothetical protein
MEQEKIKDIEISPEEMELITFEWLKTGWYGSGCAFLLSL